VKKTVLLLLLFFTIIAVNPLRAQVNEVELVSPARISLTVAQIVQESFTFQVAKGWYINSNPAAANFLIPARLRPADTQFFEIEKIEYPSGEEYESAFSSVFLSVYKDTFAIKVKLRAKENIPPGNYQIPFILSYQACQQEVCRPPANTRFTILTEVKKSANSPVSSERKTWNRLLLYAGVMAGLILIASSLKLTRKIIKKI